MKIFACLALAYFLGSCSASVPVRTAGSTDPLAPSRQLVVVRTASWDSYVGTLETYERDKTGDEWKRVHGPLAMTVGSAGLGWGTGLHGASLGPGPVKREGDRRSPAGAFSLSAVYGYAPADSVPGVAMPYIPLDSLMVCVDDPTSTYYNKVVDRSRVIEKDWNSAERMRLSGVWYRWGVIVDHNSDPRVPGAGSCIFLHVWGYPSEPTTGCTTFEEQDLVTLIRWLRPSARPAIIQLPEVEYQRLRSGWHLP